MASIEPPPPTVSAGPTSTSGFKLVLKRSSVPTPSNPPAIIPLMRHPEPAKPPAQIPTHPAQRSIPAPSTSHARVGTHPTPSRRNVAGAEPNREGEGAKLVEKESRGVSAGKYRALKRKLQDAVDGRDDTSLALYRAQKLVVRLREEKSALLDRVQMLEDAAGLTPDDILYAKEAASSRHEADTDFPLLDPPELPSLSDRTRRAPIVNNSTDLTSSTYHAPLDPSPPATSLPPRLRSQHFLSAVAAQKLRDNNDARRIARGLPVVPFPAVAILGLQGSYVAADVERALSGEAIREPDPRTVASSKRKRESTGEHASSKGKGKAVEAGRAVSTGLRDLPNPFASFVGTGAAGGRGDPQAIAAETARFSAAAAEAQVENQMEEGYASAGGGSVMSMEDQSYSGAEGSATPSGPLKAPAVVALLPGAKRSRKSTEGGEKGPKPRRSKATAVTSGVYTIPHIPRNQDGTPQLPVNAGIMVIKNLGAINTREHFSTERYFFPVGFHSMRRYASMLDPDLVVEYDCYIVEGTDKLPRFDLTASDQPGVVITAGTPTGAWTQVVKAANKIRALDRSNSVSGPDYYGLTHNVVKALVQELPGVRDVPTYIWQTFVEEPPIPSASSRALKKALKKIAPPPAPRPRNSRSGGGEEITPKPEFEYDDDEEEMNESYDQNQHYDENGREGSSRSSSAMGRSISPGESSSGFNGEGYVGGSGLSNLLHATGLPAANPYSLPLPAIDPALGSQPTTTPLYDPYAIPPPIPVAQSSTSADLNALLDHPGINADWQGYSGGFNN